MLPLATLVSVLMPAPASSPSYCQNRSSPSAPRRRLFTSTGLSTGWLPLAENQRCAPTPAVSNTSKRSLTWDRSAPSGSAGGWISTRISLDCPGCTVCGKSSEPGPSNSTTPSGVYQRYHSRRSPPFHATALVLVTVTSARNEPLAWRGGSPGGGGGYAPGPSTGAVPSDATPTAPAPAPPPPAPGSTGVAYSLSPTIGGIANASSAGPGSLRSKVALNLVPEVLATVTIPAVEVVTCPPAS